MWIDRRLYFGGSPGSQWCRNLATTPSACLNLSDEGDRAVILHGRVSKTKPDAELAVRLADVSNAKYAYGQTAANYENLELFVFAPRTVYAWTAINKDATRWFLA